MVFFSSFFNQTDFLLGKKISVLDIFIILFNQIDFFPKIISRVMQNLILPVFDTCVLR